jgi:hypothetical protein
VTAAWRYRAVTSWKLRFMAVRRQTRGGLELAQQRGEGCGQQRLRR